MHSCPLRCACLCLYMLIHVLGGDVRDTGIAPWWRLQATEQPRRRMQQASGEGTAKRRRNERNESREDRGNAEDVERGHR